ncbi:glycosyltransferase, partial [Rhizobium leguminosarum]|uniref:glycosyltransferase n=1 Tax=Rhizobium leguminosarum TaxID=384 RepID=UPI003F96E59B
MQGDAAGKMTAFDCAFDIGKFADTASRRAKRSIVTIGRFSVNKRLDHLLDALVMLKNRDPEWHLTIVGAESDLNRA